MHTVNDIRVALQKFGWPDYGVFLLMLSICALIGIYFGFIEKKPKGAGDDEADYLVGGRRMKTLPVAMSLIASYISGISLLGIPTEIYIYGISYFYIMGGIIITGFVMMSVYLPVFHDLKLTSTYEYLQTRFDRKVRLFGCILFVVSQIVWLPIVIFVPALAFNQVSGIDIHLITPITCVCCIFYTCVGGMKAVIYTDVVQSLMMFGAMLLVIIKGTYDIGGLDVVITRNVESGRIEAPKALWIFISGVFVLLAICCYCGLLIYATYFECDPLATKLAKAKDQLLPLLVMELLGSYPGLVGMFVAGVFSAALSSLSTGLNSMSAVILEDFFKPYARKPLTERQTKYIMRCVVLIFGGICVALVYVVEHLGPVLMLSVSLGSIVQGPLLGIFTCGIMFPWVTGTGALVGSATALSFMTWLCISAQRAISTGELSFDTKPVTTSGCTYSFAFDDARNETTVAPTVTAASGFRIHHISYIWYTLVGCAICIIVSLITSYFTGPNNPADMNPNLLAPFVRKLIKAKESTTTAARSKHSALANCARDDDESHF